MKRTLILLTFISLNSCIGVKSDPRRPFSEVRECVEERTGKTIYWNALCCGQSHAHERVSQLLQNELTLEDCIQIALLNNPRLQATYEMLGIAKAEVLQASLFSNPLFSGSLRYDSGFGTPYIAEVGIVESLLDILLRPLKKRVAKTELEAVKSQVAANVIDLITDIKVAYYSLQSSELSLEAMQLLRKTMEAASEVAKELRKKGNITELELALKTSQYEEARIDVMAAELDISEAREQMNALLGLWGNQTCWKISRERKQPESIPFDFIHPEECAIFYSLDLTIARLRIRRKAAKMGIEISEQVFGDVLAGGASEREPPGNWFVGPQASFALPIFDLGQAKRASNKAQLRKLINEYRALAVEIRASTRKAAFRVNNIREQYLLASSTQLPLAKKVVEETLLQNHAMQMGVFDLLEAKRDELQRELHVITLYRNCWIALTEMERLLAGRAPKSIDQFKLDWTP